MKKLLIFLVLAASAFTLHAEEYKEGVHYKKLANPQATDSGDKIEVLEFFWYGCPHCYAFEPFVNSWKKSKPENVSFARVPAIFRPDWEVQARAYYALSSMGVIEEVHGKIFEEIHKARKRLNTKDIIADFVAEHGVDKVKFLQEYDSFAVDSAVRKAKRNQALFKIEGVPSVVINGKYLTSGSMSGNYDNLVKIMNYLIKLESTK